MVKHIVMWKLMDEAEGHTKDENAKIIKQNIEGLVGKIEGIEKIEVGLNYNPNGFDVCLYSEFKNRDALQNYINHPLHKKNQAYTLSVVNDRAVADFEI